jgi:hypothetical protein
MAEKLMSIKVQLSGQKCLEGLFGIFSEVLGKYEESEKACISNTFSNCAVQDAMLDDLYSEIEDFKDRFIVVVRDNLKPGN